MKTYFVHLQSKFNFWNFFLGLALGLVIGFWVVNYLAPDAAEMLRLCKLDAWSLQQERIKK